ncbi:hypothetical protein OPV22_017568 [Ensete ventricosum]|uniref:Major facilitator superfamily (MFS) profile domain-containing protein n=1 Tax=Ensete ventricosum TaxID=4639 RepID=A0AAV8QXI5_ENSVE|nr:hypothetical protein OPV22_017568 [Ensete ventricosum]
MAVHISAATGTTATYNGRITAFVVISCVMAAMGGVIFGYDIGISGGVTSMESFLEKFFPDVNAKMRGDSVVSNYCKFDSQLLTAFTSSLYVAGLFATFIASWVTRRFGRRRTMLAGGFAFMAGAALGGAAADVYMIIFGRVLLGIGVGLANQSVPLYLSEMAPPRYRGAFNNGFQFSIGIGALIANIINYGTANIKGGWGWRVSLALAAVPALLLSLGAVFLPETPNSLIQQGGDVHNAKQLLQKIRGSTDVDQELEDLVAASNASRIVRRPLRTIVRRNYRPQLVMAIAIPFFQQVIIAGILATQLGDQGGVSRGYAYLVLLLICVYVAGFGWSWGPLGWLVPSEIFPLEIRSAGQSITVAVSFIFTFIIAQTYLAMLCHMKSGIFFFFAGWLVIMTMFTHMLLPETRNIPMEQMAKVWREHPFWRRIVVDEGEESKTDG